MRKRKVLVKVTNVDFKVSINNVSVMASYDYKTKQAQIAPIGQDCFTFQNTISVPNKLTIWKDVASAINTAIETLEDIEEENAFSRIERDYEYECR